MTPYARRSTTLSRAREAENVAWAARGDARSVGPAAHAKMSAAMRYDVSPIVNGAVELAMKLFGKFFDRRKGP